jgi:hypothetical protein
VKGRLLVNINRGRRERGLPMSSLDHEYLVDCFDGYFQQAFHPEANNIGFDLEDANPFTRRPY